MTIGESIVELMEQTFWMADGVGLVRSVDISTESDHGGELTITETSELMGFDLQ
jgi:hypothetical protein